jgi:putative sterol carrier protein
MEDPATVLEEVIKNALTDPSNKQKIKGLNKTLQFKPSGADPFYLEIANDTATVKKGNAQNAVATIIMSAQDMVDMFRGKLNPISAFMSGRLRVEGNLFEAQSLAALLG